MDEEDAVRYSGCFRGHRLLVRGISRRFGYGQGNNMANAVVNEALSSVSGAKDGDDSNVSAADIDVREDSAEVTVTTTQRNTTGVSSSTWIPCRSGAHIERRSTYFAELPDPPL